ncbi:helix-turn-helix domain-containing protein [Desulfomonile tiedjei]|uniref:DNA-binding domain-containing protein, AraC-type n=1 Tax=Desulfomonile tiedjei (strain ATCC 49306 / DSM 6799 / DCB-1) TaxID=706587 RepID=I4CEN8_DESTA|nr:helix-turn-helix domain-containing protein [Desulfomonile tiedjei]AFM28029.1 DNA-binding domain-containing protein, AraC-type [Desulfomonile tiedjei DSM 6799]
MPVRFSTKGVKEKDRFSYWREVVCDVYVLLGCESEMADEFHGGLVLERLPGISVSSVFSDPLTVNRRKKDIARSNDDCFLLGVQLKNKVYVIQHDRIAELDPGDFAIYSSTEPYQLLCPRSYKQLVFQFPKSDLLARLPNCELLMARKVSRGNEIGRLVSGSLVDFSRIIGNTDEVVQHYMKDTVLDLIATGLASLENSTFELSRPEQHLMLRAKSYIHANLGNSDLSREMVAKAMGMSVRRLSGIFSKEGTTITAYIRFMRLERIARDLLNDLFHRQSISEIAFRWGFNNLQHFSKVFRIQYGMSPRDYRQHARPLWAV